MGFVCSVFQFWVIPSCLLRQVVSCCSRSWVKAQLIKSDLQFCRCCMGLKEWFNRISYLRFSPVRCLKFADLVLHWEVSGAMKTLSPNIYNSKMAKMTWPIDYILLKNLTFLLNALPCCLFPAIEARVILDVLSLVHSLSSVSIPPLPFSCALMWRCYFPTNTYSPANPSMHCPLQCLCSV